MRDRSTSDHTTVDERADQPHPDDRRDEISHEDRHRDEYPHDPVAADHAEARDRFGGTNAGAAFFGWLVAIAMTVLLTGVVGAVAAAVGTSAQVTQTEAEREAGTIGIVAAAVLAAIMLLAYYTGGYVAGRMSRFDGARQGLAVWLIGLLVTAVAAGVGLLFGREYDVLSRVDLPSVPLGSDELGTAGIITAAVIVVGTALAAMLGGKVGHRYHDKVDRVAYHHR
ncbi:MAG TPA: hypothetical protein VFZ64_17130 [Nocardioidaceae bacterium]